MNHSPVIYAESELDQEQWRDIPNYTGIYQASNLGRIRTAPGKTTESIRHGTRKWKKRVLKNRGETPQTGYRVSLWKNKTATDYLVARLVAMSWHGNPGEEMTVNHIDGNRLNNRIENLEWLTIGDNIRHAFATGLMPTEKPVVLLDENKRPIYFQSQSAASRWLGKNNQFINQHLQRGSRTACGYTIFTA